MNHIMQPHNIDMLQLYPGQSASSKPPGVVYGESQVAHPS
jgi:hypothetical protein